LIVNAKGLPMKAEITGGEVSDYKGFDALLDDELPLAKVFIADKGYDSDGIRNSLEANGATPVIPGRANRKQPIQVDAFIYALRNQIERCFNKLKCSRRLATRYDKTAASYLGFIHIVAARLWFRSLST
jgi:transposase